MADQEKDSIFSDQVSPSGSRDSSYESAKIDELLGQIKKDKRKHHNVILFIPLMLGLLVLAIALVTSGITHIARSPQKMDISLYSKQNVLAPDENDSWVDITLNLTNNTSANVNFIDFDMVLKDEQGNVLLSTPMTLSGSIFKGDSVSTTYNISPYLESRVGI